MNNVTMYVGGAVGGLAAYLLATQLALLTAGDGGGTSPLRQVLGVAVAATLVAAGVLAGSRWSTATAAGAAVAAVLVVISLFTFDGAAPNGMLVSVTDLMRYGASSHLPISLAAAAGASAAFSGSLRRRAGTAATPREPAAH